MKNTLIFLLVSTALVGCGNDRVDSACSATSAIGLEDQLQPYEEIRLPVTPRSSARARVWNSAQPPEYGIIFVSGVDGGFIEPVDGIYQRMASRFARQRTASIFVEYRYSGGHLEKSVEDALAAAKWLRSQGVKKMAIVGWSFGGAVITNTAVKVPEIRTVMGFAVQARYTEAVRSFRSQSILLFHDYADDNVPYEAVEQILTELPVGTKSKHLPITGSDHYLSGKRDEIDPVATQWLVDELAVSQCTS